MEKTITVKRWFVLLLCVLFLGTGAFAGCSDLGGTGGPEGGTKPSEGSTKPPEGGSDTDPSDKDPDGGGTPSEDLPHVPGWTLVWGDEFDGTQLDLTKWDYQLGVQDDYYGTKGPWAWGNNEQQYYTKEAATVSDGILTIRAIKESMPEGRKYSSARLVTRDRYSFTYGYTEARMQTPAVNGMWPAFWALPQPLSHSSTQNKYGGWPYSGEIDIMEAKGREKNVVGTTLHFGGSAGSWQSTYRWHSTTMQTTTEEWHTYGLEWQEDHIAWYVDRVEVFRLHSTDWWTGAAKKQEAPSAPFDVPFYLLLDLAIGGNYDGGVEPPQDFVSADMCVDYVRVYQIV